MAFRLSPTQDSVRHTHPPSCSLDLFLLPATLPAGPAGPVSPRCPSTATTQRLVGGVIVYTLTLDITYDEPKRLRERGLDFAEATLVCHIISMRKANAREKALFAQDHRF